MSLVFWLICNEVRLAAFSTESLNLRPIRDLCAISAIAPIATKFPNYSKDETDQQATIETSELRAQSCARYPQPGFRHIILDEGTSRFLSNGACYS
jgi:hypothetical protein